MTHSQASNAEISPQAALAFNRANAAWREGLSHTGLEAIDEALSLAPDFPPARLLKARLLRHTGQLEEARTWFERCLNAPDRFDATLELGNLLRALAQPDAARTQYLAAAALRPHDTRPGLALTRLEEELSDNAAEERAAIAFEQALAAARFAEVPKLKAAELHYHLARYRIERGRPAKAIEALRLAKLLAPQSATELRENIGVCQADVLFRLGATDRAKELITVLSASTRGEVLSRLSQICTQFRCAPQAVQLLKRRAELDPGNALLWYELASSQIEIYDLEAAAQSLERTQQCSNSDSNCLQLITALSLQRSGDVARSLEIYDQFEHDKSEDVVQRIAMNLLYVDHLTPQEVAARHRELFSTWGTPHQLPVSDPNPDRPLRIAFVTADLHHQHPVDLFMKPIFEHWDHVNFPMTIYYTGQTVDDRTRRARSLAGQWTEVHVHELSASLRRDQIDILIDLAGHTNNSPLRHFARRLAPIQLSYLGYPGSTGVPNVDWLIGDPIVTPPEDDALCSEQVMRLPNTVFCYAPDQDYPLPDFDAMADRPLTFGSFNNIAKLNPTTIALWSQLLCAVPQSRLLLRSVHFASPSVAARFKALFAAHGVAQERLICTGAVALCDMMQAYAQIDIALDPTHYGGGTTTLQALWMGVPVLSLRGGHFVSRMGASFLTGAGLTDWIAETPEEFVQKGQAFAADRARLLALKRNLRAQLVQRPAWQPAVHSQSFLDALRKVWHKTLTAG